MAEDENLVLDYLRLMRSQLDRMDRKLDDVIARLGHVERAMAGHWDQLREINSKFDRLSRRRPAERL